MDNLDRYVLAFHIVFIVTWFSGLFYIVRLFIYNTEAGGKNDAQRTILREQYAIMIRRLWYGITWPSAILTLVFGSWLLYLRGYGIYYMPAWLLLKLHFVAGLLIYHFSLQVIYRQQSKNIFKYSSLQLRVWNEVATIFLISIVVLVCVKTALSWWMGVSGLLLLVILILVGILLYKKARS